MFLSILILPKKLETKKCFCWYLLQTVFVCVNPKNQATKKIHDDWFILQRATFLWWRRGLQTKKFCT